MTMWFGIKAWTPFYVCAYISYVCMHMFYTVSSPYLLVFGNGRVLSYTRAYNVAGGSGVA